MKRKSLAFLVVLAMLASVLTAGGWTYKTEGASSGFKPSLPSFSKLDKDIQMDAAANGEKLQGKNMELYNSKAYFKPQNPPKLQPKDVRGEKKGIAILVDFPVSEGKLSDVPGVNYERIPAQSYNDLLNGTTYNPYTLDVFKWIAEKARERKIEPATDRTLKNYYNEVSYNQFGIDVDVVDWITLPHTYDYYLGQDKGYANENGDAYIGQLISDAIDGAKAKGINFADYAVPAQPGDFADLYGSATSFEDKDGKVIDKIVPNIFVIHRGTGAEYSRDPSIIWSHKWDILSANYFGEYNRTGSYPSDDSLSYKVIDGVVVNTYNICPEVGQDLTGFRGTVRKPSPADVGVFAHEFGHVLGLPDQYDYGYESEGTGMYTLMSGGSYGRDINTGDRDFDRYFSGFSPTHMDAWSKYFLGFAKPKEIKAVDGKTTITLNPASKSADIYKIVVPGSDGREYFLLENRQQTGFDAGLAYNVDVEKLHGLAIYHIDEDVLSRNFHRPNEAANWDWNYRGRNYKDPETGENHYGISLVQADGNWDMEKGINDADAGDLYGGKYTNLSPSIKSNPSTISYTRWGKNSRNYTGITIENIVENQDGTVTATVYFAK